MTYSVDLRGRVVDFVRGGGSKSEAARRFRIGEATVYRWLSAKRLAPKVQGRRRRKLDWEALRRDVAARPDALLRERAAHFGVQASAIWHALREMKLSHKKSLALRRKGS